MNKTANKIINRFLFTCAFAVTAFPVTANPDLSYIEGRDYIVVNESSGSSSSTVLQANSYSGRILDNLITEFSLPAQGSEEAIKRITSQYNWYKNNPEYMQRVWQRAELYMFHIKEELQKRNMPMELALLPIVESAFDPFAYSHGRASGLWQIIPGTGKYLKVKQNWWYDGRRDVLDSTRAALDYLEGLHKEFNGDWMLAIAAYNSGAGNVRKGIRRNKRKQKSTDFWSIPLPKETKAYVPKLLALKKLFMEPATRNILPQINNREYFKSIDTQSQIDLATAASLAKIDLDTLYQLNPGFNHWATAPKGPHRLLVPAEKAHHLEAGLQALPDSKRIKLQRYKVRSGDTLSVLAKRNKTSIKAIQAANDMRGSSLRAGKHILIPQASTDLSEYGKSMDARLQRLQNTKRSGDKTTYQAKSGDSFWTIAKKYGVTHRQVAKWNGMAPRDTLKIGQNLVIWKKSKNANATSNSSNFNPQTQRRISYKVRSGDTLSGIAAKFKVKTSQLRAWNKSRLGKYLRPGQNLKILIDVRKQSG